MTRRRRLIAGLVAAHVTFASGPLVRAQEPGPPAVVEDAPDKATLSGRLVDLDRRTPWGGRQVRLVDAARRTIAVLTTDAEGRFVLPPLPEEGCWLLVGGLRARLSPPEDRTCEVVVVVPRSMIEEEPPIPMADGLMPVMTTSNTVIIVIGTTVLLVGVGAGAGAIGYYAAKTGKKVRYLPAVSPSTP